MHLQAHGADAEEVGLMSARSFLFAPGDSPKKMEKAYNSGADAVILDLEDSVAPSAKTDARELVAAFLREHAQGEGPELWVRINPLTGGQAEADLDSVAGAAPHGIILPKPDSAADVISLSQALDARERSADLPAGGIAILPIATETPASVFQLHTYAGSSGRLAGLTWGAEDLSSAIGAVSARDGNGELTSPYQIARALCLAGAAAAEVAPIETVYPDFRDLEGLERYVSNGRRDGFVGMMAIHPAQVEVINRGFTPSADEVDFARRVVELFAANPGAATLGLDGRMLDRPHLVQAERLLARLNGRADTVQR